jgi:hypothetical protein
VKTKWSLPAVVFTFSSGNAGGALQWKGLTPNRDAVAGFLEDAA